MNGRIGVSLLVALGLVLSLRVAFAGPATQANHRAQFVEDCAQLAARRDLSYLACVPDKPPLDIPEQIRKPVTWNDYADRFAIRWRVTWREADGYLLSGPQYNAMAQETAYYSEIETVNKAVAAFVEALTAEQQQVLAMEMKLPLQALTPDQRRLLLDAVLASHRPLPLPDPSLPDPADTTASLRLRNPLQLIVFSNGAPMGMTSSDGSFSIMEEPTRLDVPATAAGKVLDIPGDAVTTGEILRSTIASCWPDREARFKPSIAMDTPVVASTAKVPLTITLQFIAHALGYEIRQVGDLVSVGLGPALRNEEAEKARVLTTIAPLLGQITPLLRNASFPAEGDWQGMKRAWREAPSLFLSSRPRYRVELSASESAALSALDPALSWVLETHPKVAVAPAIGPMLFVFTGQGERNELLGHASALLLPARPVDALVGH